MAMGRYGGYELGYGSDADVMFVHEPLPGVADNDASPAAHAVAEELRRLLALPAPDPPLVIDPGLRPEGRQGPLVRTLESYASYYRRWSAPWESQALLRAAPVIGDEGLRSRFQALIDPVRWPEGGIDDTALREIRRLKARMEAERLPRGVDRRLHTKLGPGGLSDVEWVAQLLQLRHAHEVAGLRTTRTLTALDAAVKADLLDPDDAETLANAWRMATRIRNAIMLVRGRALGPAADRTPSRTLRGGQRPGLPGVRRSAGGLPPPHPPRPQGRRTYLLRGRRRHVTPKTQEATRDRRRSAATIAVSVAGRVAPCPGPSRNGLFVAACPGVPVSRSRPSAGRPSRRVSPIPHPGSANRRVATASAITVNAATTPSSGRRRRMQAAPRQRLEQ